MALVRCAECGNAVSTSAAACPKCGAPITVATSTPGSAVAPSVPYRPFWIPSRIVGAVVCGLGVAVLVWGFVHMNSIESQLKRRLGQEDWPLYASFIGGAVLLFVGVPLFAGVMRLLNRTGQIACTVLLLAIPPAYLIGAYLGWYRGPWP